ncbi:MAG: hypothetical protein K8T91_15120 [Planctomycetes bacterium]|nr:hypothetical protein [Planctomycetota bacterium]
MIFAAILAIAIGGCNSDERVAQVATEAANRQAQQNTEMAKVTNQVAEGSRELVEADSEARREIVKVHQELQAERSRLGEQWNQLEGERQEIAQDRRTESMLVPAIQAVGAIAVAILAIGFCLSLLFGLRKNNEADAILGELLIHEIIAEEPRLLTKQHIRALPGSDDCCPGLDPPSLGGNRSDPEPPSQ